MQSSFRPRSNRVALRRLSPVVLAAFALPFLGACQQFFTTSLGAWADRGAPSISASLSAEDTMALADEAIANNDRETAVALLPAMENNLADATPGTAAYDELSAVVAEATVVATGVSQALNDIIQVIPLEDIIADPASLTLDAGTIADIDAIIDSISLPADAAAIFTALAAEPGAATPDQLVMAALAVAVATNPAISLGGVLDDPSTMPALDPVAQSLMDAALAQSALYPEDSDLFDMLDDFLL